MKVYEVKQNSIPDKVEGRNFVELLEGLESHYLHHALRYGGKLSGESLNEYLSGEYKSTADKFKKYLAYSEEVKGYVTVTILRPMDRISFITIEKPLDPLIDELSVEVKLGDCTRQELT